jgi:hypothetical protein
LLNALHQEHIAVKRVELVASMGDSVFKTQVIQFFYASKEDEADAKPDSKTRG